MSGIAFEVRAASYSQPNRTLASMACGRENGCVAGGEQIKHALLLCTPCAQQALQDAARHLGRRGQLALRSGGWCRGGRRAPLRDSFKAAGLLTSADQSSYEHCQPTTTASQLQVKTACDVAYYNVLSCFQALERGSRLRLPPEALADFCYGASVAGDSEWAKGILAPSMPSPPEDGDSGEHQPASPRFDAPEGESRTADGARTATTAGASKHARLPMFRLRLVSGAWPDVLRKPRCNPCPGPSLVAPRLLESLPFLPIGMRGTTICSTSPRTRPISSPTRGPTIYCNREHALCSRRRRVTHRDRNDTLLADPSPGWG